MRGTKEEGTVRGNGETHEARITHSARLPSSLHAVCVCSTHLISGSISTGGTGTPAPTETPTVADAAACDCACCVCATCACCAFLPFELLDGACAGGMSGRGEALSMD
jgi:hypothetical protein